jgi:acyl carrier protein
MLEQELIAYVRARSHVANVPIDANTPLFSEGILDSMAVLEVTALVERKTGVHFAVAEINLDNLDSIGRILRFVNSRQPRMS